MRNNKIIISESKLNEIVDASIKKVLNDTTVICSNHHDTLGRNILNEMARLNKKDDTRSPFPSNKYKLWVQGDNSPHKPPHMHVSYPQEGWQIKVFIENGELWQVVSFGNRGRTDSFSDIVKMVKEWFTLPTTMPGRVGTNQNAAENEWDACNDD